MFRDGDGCSSNIGRAIITGLDDQSITLNHDDCDDPGIAMHEIGHAIGLYHEQSRNDRDAHIVVDFGQVQLDKLDQFFQWGEASRDWGTYDYGSIMHYTRWAFAQDEDACKAGNLAACTIRPDDPTANIGQRTVLSEHDILGAYMLYPPAYEIVGATPGASGDHFRLSLAFTTRNPRGDLVVWTSDHSPTPLGTGASIDLQAGRLPAGPQVITASFVVAGVTVMSRSISLDFENHAPAVSLVPTDGRTVHGPNEVFSVVAAVSDPEDGACPPGVCHYRWLPAPTTGPADGQTASYAFATPGPKLITVQVEDAGGAVTSAGIIMNVVNTPPVAVIVSPNSPSVVVSGGVQLQVTGFGRDPDLDTYNHSMPCNANHWSSSNPADVVAHPSYCNTSITFSGPGVRTISLVVTDELGATSPPATLEVTVNDCTGSCPPTGILVLSPPDLEVSGQPVYMFDHAMQVKMLVADAGAPDASPVHYRLTAERSGETPIFLAEGDREIVDPTELMVANVASWTPLDAIAAWPDCDSPPSYRDWDLVLVATDAHGESSTTRRSVTLGCPLH